MTYEINNEIENATYFAICLFFFFSQQPMSVQFCAVFFLKKVKNIDHTRRLLNHSFDNFLKKNILSLMVTYAGIKNQR